MTRTHAQILQHVVSLALVSVVASACQGGGSTAQQNAPPIASISATPTSGPAPLTVAFDGSGSTAPDGVITAYVWSFGDGSGTTGVGAEHTYAQPGSFVATLAITDDRGVDRSASVTIEVTDGGTGNGGDDGGDESAVTASTARSFHGASEAVLVLPGELIVRAVDMAITATVLNGDTTVTGTLTETSPGTDTQPGTFTYASEPTDRLRVLLLNGSEFDITFFGIPQGTFSDGGSGFVDRPHIIDVEITSNAAASALDVRVTSTPAEAANTQQGSFVGAFTDGDGVRWTFDLNLERYHREVAEITGNEVESIMIVAGALAAPAQSISGTVGRYLRYRLVNTAENTDHRYDHAFARDGVSYAFAGRIFVALSSSQPVDRDQWEIQGGLTRDGVLVGQFVVQEDVTGLDVSLGVGSERIPLYAVSYF